MRDRELYSRILGLHRPWRVSEVELALGQGPVRVHAELEADAPLVCPQCAKVVPGYDKRRRHWRHLDTCRYQTILVADVPRVQRISLAGQKRGRRGEPLPECCGRKRQMNDLES